jgi:hypothetical protein
MASTEEISEILVNWFLGGRRRGDLLGLFLLLLLLFRSFLLGGAGGNSSRGATSDSLLTLRDQLVQLLSLKATDDSVEFLIRDLRSDVSEERLEVCGF